MIKFIFREEDALAAVNYIAKKIGCSDLDLIYSILYLAERKYLARFAHPITGDTFVMKGDIPVPVYTSKLVKLDHAIDPEHVLPEAAVECLEEVIKEVADLSFEEISKKYEAEKMRFQGKEIPVEEMILIEGGDEDTLKLAEFYSENELVSGYIDVVVL